jgi:hypothetical protein
MTFPLRSALVVVAAFSLASVVSACSGVGRESTAEAVGTAGDAKTDAIAVQISSMFLTIENRAGQPLLDIGIAIKPVGGTMPYTSRISRLEPGGRREVPLGNFAGRDGTPFSLRVVRPREVTVTAVDFVGQKHAVTVPWNR